jgi:hypothetical protein
VKDVVIKYDEVFSVWEDNFKKALDYNGIIYTDDMITNICRSLSNTVSDYLLTMGYRPKNTYSYRLGFMKRLSQSGLTLNIKTNWVFWKYLEYFTDLTDYSKGFDIKIEIENIELATKDMRFYAVTSDNKRGVVSHPIHSKEYAEITKKLDLARTMAKNGSDPRIIRDITSNILDILDYLVRRVD